MVQCKHYAGTTFAGLCSSARGELPKITKEKPDRYIFATTQSLSRTQKETLERHLHPWLKSGADLLAQADINGLLGRHPEVEQQHFKLWLASTAVLDRLLRSEIWTQGEALLEDIRDRVKVYVHTEAFSRASHVLEEKHVAVLTGPPGVGKSLLAEMLALTYCDRGWQIIVVDDDINEAWSTHQRERKQVFLYDDFLGQTDLSERRRESSTRLIKFMERVSRDPTKRLIMTTRSQVLRQALELSEPLARSDFRAVECAVRIADYGPFERARILYNHLYFSTLPRPILRTYVSRKAYWQAVKHANFSPRIVDLVTKRSYSTADDFAQSLNRALDHPLDLYYITFVNSMSDVARRIVLSLITFPMRGVRLAILKKIISSDAKPIEYTRALRVLEGTFIKLDRDYREREPLVAYAAPTARDFVLTFLDEEPEYLLEILMSAQSAEQLSTLLAYASSVADGRFKFPRLAEFVTRKQSIVARRIKDLSGRPNVTSVYGGSYTLGSATLATAPLIRSLRPASRLMPGEFDSLLRATLALIEADSAENLDREDFNEFCDVLIATRSDSLGDYQGLLERVLELWGEALGLLDDVAEYVDFFERLRACPAYWNGLEEILQNAVSRGLWSDIDLLMSTPRDLEPHEVEPMRDHLNDLERMARRVGVLDMIQDQLDLVRSVDDGRGEEPVSIHSSDAPSMSAPKWHNRYMSLADDAEIEELFGNLS